MIFKEKQEYESYVYQYYYQLSTYVLEIIDNILVYGWNGRMLSSKKLLYMCVCTSDSSTLPTLLDRCFNAR